QRCYVRRPSAPVPSGRWYTAALQSSVSFPSMRFLAVAAGFPVTALVIWALIRSPLAARVSAEPRDDRWHERTTPMVGGIGIFAGIVTGFLLAIAVGAAPASRELLAIVGACGVLRSEE